MALSRCWIAALVVAVAAEVGAAGDRVRLAGRTLADVLDDYQAAGYRFVYSSELVGDLRLQHEPGEGHPIGRLRESLLREGLTLRRGTGGATYRIVAVENAEPVATGRPDRVLSGRVTDAATGLPLIGVRVEIDGALATTDAEGRFAVETRGPGVISASREGYVRRTLAAPAVPETGESTRGEVAFGLEPAIEEVVVSASRYRVSRVGFPSRHAMDRTTLAALPDIGDDPLRIVNQLPGASTLGVSAMPHIRGGVRDESLVVFDGVELLEPFHLKDFQGVFSGVDPRVVKSIDVYTGGFPARYGNRMSGVLDMASADPPARLGGALSLSVIDTGVLARGPVAGHRGDWVVAARRGNLDLLASSFDPQLGRPSFADAYAGFQWEIGPRTTASLGTLFYDDDVEFVDMDEGTGEQASSRYANVYAWAKLDHQWTTDLAMQTLVSFGNIRHDRFGVARNVDPDKSDGDIDDRRRFRFAGLKHRGTLSLDRWSVEYGGGVESVSGRYAYEANVRRPTLALLLGVPMRSRHDIDVRPQGRNGHAYGSVRFSPLGAMTVEAGLRWDVQTYRARSDWQLSPRLSLRLGDEPGTLLRVAVGSFSQPQGIHELQVADGVSRYQPPQRALHFIVGVERQLPVAGLEVVAEAYLKTFDRVNERFENAFDPFVLLPETAPDRVAVAPSRARAAGAEVTLRYRPSDALRAWMTVAAAKAEDRVDGRWRPRRWNQRTTLSAGLLWNRPPWSASTTVLWHDGWRTTRLPQFATADQVFLPEWNADHLPAFATLNARFSRTWQWPGHSLTLFAEGANLLDRANIGAIEYELDADEGRGGYSIVGEGELMFPLVPSVGLVWEYR